MSRTQHQGDIDCAFYIAKECTANKSITLTQLLELQQLLQQHLPPKAQERFRILPGAIATWHGFIYNGQECDITFKELAPTPVVSHCCIFFRFNDHLVKFLANGDHALLHIRTNRLNIIAPKEQHLEPAIMAHILKKVFGYLDKGVKLTQKSKIILGNLLMNEQEANRTIAQFICSYGHKNPDYYCHKFSNLPLEVIIQGKAREITLAQYMMHQAVRTEPHISTDYAIDILQRINFKRIFQMHTRPSLLINDIFQYCLSEVKRNQAQDLGEHVAPMAYFWGMRQDTMLFFAPPRFPTFEYEAPKPQIPR